MGPNGVTRVLLGRRDEKKQNRRGKRMLSLGGYTPKKATESLWHGPPPRNLEAM